MNQNKLQALLADLHRELSSAKSLDPDSQQMLEQVLQDVRQLKPVPDGAGADLTDRLRESALRLESEHPRLANALGQLGDALAKLGI